VDDDEKPGIFEHWEDVVVLLIVGIAIWIMLGALGYSVWIWFG
jgi:hypothetical protein